MESPYAPSMESNNPSAKRKRSLSGDAPTHYAAPVKVAKTHSNHLQINYLARQTPETLPLVSEDDTMPSILSLVIDYDGVLQRHESMAGNLGARPLGPILIKRFERLFDGPPRVLKTHGKEGTTVTWLDVVEFARNKPEQFNLEKMRDGVRVCQFYTKQSRVEISEEDYLLIASGMPQKLIPPQPIVEDEEKELGTLEILEKNLGKIVQLADQVSARARQLNHRLKNRRNAIISRRETEATSNEDHSAQSPLLSPHTLSADPTSSNLHSNGEQRTSHSPTSGFVAVNSRVPVNTESSFQHSAYPLSLSEHPRTANVTIVNGTPLHGASPATRAELLSKFFTTTERANSIDFDITRRPSASASRLSAPPKSKSKPSSEPVDYASVLLNSASPVPIPNTPSSLLPHANKPSPADRFDDSGPYKAEMVARMEQLQRGDRIMPPCDRCRRLHMDCLKNLTACMGCTKKHAKCSWKEVRDEELAENAFVRNIGDDAAESSSHRASYPDITMSGGEDRRRSYGTGAETDIQGVRDEELLGEEGSDGDDDDDRPTEYHALSTLGGGYSTLNRASHEDDAMPSHVHHGTEAHGLPHPDSTYQDNTEPPDIISPRPQHAERREGEPRPDAYISERIFETVTNPNQPLTVYASGKMEQQGSAEQENGDLLGVQTEDDLHRDRIIDLESQSRAMQT
ncbi:c6 finger domain protein [Lasallia pustulata]|uniref:C6 finger domain protein n=1 Tax=Lasallia pustulata TaxID=136370 RepID=A0A1W5D6A4_9LECA|nr:c6 finger domain protein [Lasallia pustulata]